MSRQSIVSVQCAQKPLAPGIDFQHLSLTQSLFDHHSFSLMLPFDRVESPKEAFFSQAPERLLGQSVEVEIESDPQFAGKGAPRMTFKGLVTGLGTSKDTDYANSVTV